MTLEALSNQSSSMILSSWFRMMKRAPGYRKFQPRVSCQISHGQDFPYIRTAPSLSSRANLLLLLPRSLPCTELMPCWGAALAQSAGYVVPGLQPARRALEAR